MDPLAVRRRHVFYVPGFDPFPARRYRELYRRESAKAAARADWRIGVSPVAGSDGTSWRVAGEIEGAPVEALFEVLVWHDLVRASMRGGIAARYLSLVRTLWVYLGTGALTRLVRLRKGPVLAGAWPVAAMAVQAAVALGLGLAAVGLAGLAMPAPWHWAAGVVAWPVLALFGRLDRHLYAHYLLADYAWSASCHGAYPDALEARLQDWAARVSDALRRGEAEEILVVGHSSGAHLAVSLVADVVRQSGPRRPAVALSLLTLGHAVPMMSFLPEARRLRRDLAWLSRRPDVTWIDVSAPGDGCSFALCDPVSVSGVAPQDKRWPLVVSAAFSRTLSRETRDRLRWRFFRLHFQYLCAFDGPGLTADDYDYFRITAGPRTLAARYDGRKASRSRIERPLSPHTSMAA